MKKSIDVVAALIRKNNKFFLCRRKEEDNFGGLWEFPGGGVEEGETLFQAIEREIKEETDLTIKADNFIAEFFDENDYLRIKVFLFSCSIFKGKPEPKDCQDLGFFTLNEAEQLDLAPVDRKIINFLKNKRSPA